MNAQLPPLREVIERHGLRARKSMGQNFLLDLNLTDKIARAAGDLANSTVIEVGPGPGGLTRSLLAAGARMVVAIERDRRCIPALDELAAHYPDRLRIIEDDALKTDLAEIADGSGMKIVANLPYNIATGLLVRWLTGGRWPPCYETMVLMFQREVGERLWAAPNSRAYGRLSVLTQWRCAVSHLFDIPARAFTPPPKVTSTVVHLVPKETPSPHCQLQTLERVTGAAFGQRRKMLRASLKALHPDPVALLEAASIDPAKRAETIDVAGFCRLANCFDGMQNAAT